MTATTREVITPAAIPAPVLKIDSLLFSDRPMPAHCKRERHIVANLFAHLAANGIHPAAVDDGGEDWQETPLAVDAMELIFNVDMSKVRFYCGDGALHWVLLVCGNGEDIVSDFSYSAAGTDNFREVVESFCDRIYSEGF